jgi:hypothetical protein
MSCPTARVLFEESSKAIMEYFEAADNSSTLVGLPRRVCRNQEAHGAELVRLP